tara:strand:- start:290 stop:715 length:426 start_codon:yes stop_codon:yes gene_type:complete
MDKESILMKKLKELLKESYVWERKFGEKLPTLASIQEKKKLKELLKESYVWERKFGEKLPTLASIQEKKKLKEVGAGAQYRKFYKDIERQQKGLSKSVDKFKSYLLKQGLKSKARELEDNYLVDSYGWMRKWLKKFISKLM